jgi:Mitochondrial carrier protein
MQIQQGFTRGGAWEVAKKMWHKEGVRAFFHGMIPPLWGSVVYRGAMMSSYEFAYTSFEKYDEAVQSYKAGRYCRNGNVYKDTIVQMQLDFHSEIVWGVRPMVPLSSIFAGLVRSLVEAPIEYAKVMGQVDQKWKLSQLYRGFGYQVLRTTTLIMPIFTVIDIARKKTTLLVCSTK